MLSSSYFLGLIFVVLVAIIWAASSVLTQYLYSDEQDFHSPFLLTYIGVSLFTLWLPTTFVTNGIKERCKKHFQEEEIEAISATPYSISRDVVVEVHEASSSTEDEEVPLEVAANGEYTQVEARQTTATPWTNKQHFHAAIRIAPIWFAANWTYNASLAYTSITSSTVLASTGSLFTFLFAVLLKDERFGWAKLAGVLLGVSGAIITALTDRSKTSSSDEQETDCVADGCKYVLLGDFLGLVSAIGYGAYAVQTRILCPHDESLYSMQVLLGYIGLSSMLALSPIAIWQLTGGRVELTLVVFGFLFVKGLFDNVISDYLWLRAVILTNATVATCGLGLTIPLAFASDMLLGKPTILTMGSIAGAIAVLTGFILVNVGNAEDDEIILVNVGNAEDDEIQESSESMMPMQLVAYHDDDTNSTEEEQPESSLSADMHVFSDDHQHAS